MKVNHHNIIIIRYHKHNDNINNNKIIKYNFNHKVTHMIHIGIL